MNLNAQEVGTGPIGWTCPSCGQFVANGCMHSCGTFVSPPPLFAATSTGCAHEWLPWCRLDSGEHVTRCVRCGREERWPLTAETTTDV